jgi:acyl-CoA reductase-like NAD-dependent aldehyde dehydrogenase
MAVGTAQEMFVEGKWVPSASGETFEAFSPASGELIGTIPQGDRDYGRLAGGRRVGAADRV